MNEEILVMAIGLRPGETSHGNTCPACGGGRSNDKSFSVSISHDDYLLYHCHRATCGYSGRIPTAVRTTTAPVAHREPKHPPGPRTPLSERPDLINKVKEWYGITYNTMQQRQVSVHGDQLCIHIWNHSHPYLADWSYEYRYLPPVPEGCKKSMHYRMSDMLWYADFSFLDRENPKPVWIVEDTWSALKTFQEWGTGIALMGTHFSDEVAIHLATVYGSDRTFYLALDKDATEKAFKYQQKFKFILPNLRVVPLSKDMKYLNRKQMEELL